MDVLANTSLALWGAYAVLNPMVSVLSEREGTGAYLLWCVLDLLDSLSVGWGSLTLGLMLIGMWIGEFLP